jgi:hypothetical protein
LKYFFKDAVYFVMKSNNHENVMLAKSQGVWSTPPQNEHKLNRAFQEFRNVILIFSVKESGRFQGFARLSSESSHEHRPVPWVLPPGLNSKVLGGVFSIDWICCNDLPFSKTVHLFNPLNEGKPVKIGRDGQEIDVRVAEELCRLFTGDQDMDLIPLLKRMKKQTANRPKPARRMRNIAVRDVRNSMHGESLIPPQLRSDRLEPLRRPPRERLYNAPSAMPHNNLKRKRNGDNNQAKRSRRDYHDGEERYRSREGPSDYHREGHRHNRSQRPVDSQSRAYYD